MAALVWVSTTPWDLAGQSDQPSSEWSAEPWEGFRDLGAWRVTELADRPSLYEVVERNGDSVLRATSRNSASLLSRPVESDLTASTEISWRWRVEAALDHDASELERDGDDYAARVFVVFGEPQMGRDARAICYVWAANQAVGAVFPSPYAEGVVTIVLQSGNSNQGTWLHERRDFAADYQSARGVAPGPVAAVAVMTDTDNTSGSATAWYDDFYLR